MEKDFADILKHIGYTDGLQIPVANEENQQLQKDIEYKLKQKAELLIKLENEEDQKTRAINSLENIRKQKVQNQQIILALKNQNDSERTLLKECTLGRSTTHQKVANMNKEIHESKEKQCSLRAEVRRMMKKLDDLKAMVQWGEEARKAWNEELKVGERDNNILQRFKVEDKAKFKEMDLKRRQLKIDVMERHNTLKKVVHTLGLREHQLQNMTHFFKRILREQMTLISYWENAVRNLHQREHDIESSYRRIQKLKRLCKKNLETVAEEQKFLEVQCLNNEELQQQLEVLNAEVNEVKKTGLEGLKFVHEAKHEEAKIRKFLSDLGRKLERARTRCTRMDETIKIRTAREFNHHQPIADLTKRLEDVTESVISAAERKKELKEILKSSETTVQQLNDKYAVWKKKVLEKTREYNELKSVTKRITEQVTQMTVNERAYEETRLDLERQLMEKENTLYDLNMESVMLHHRLRKTMKDMGVEEQLSFKVRAWELDEAIKKDTKKMRYVRFRYKKLKAAADRIEEGNKQIKLDIKDILIERGHVMFGLEGTNKHFAIWQQNVKNTQVTLSVFRLRVHQREKQVEKQDSQVTDLEVEKLELGSAIRERKLEISLQMELMAAKKRTLEEEKSELKRAFDHLKIRVSQIQKKHDIVMDCIGKGEDGEPFSVARFKIKMAQERYELEEIGDELNAKIKKAESEIPAMENTLKVISAANECYKKNLDSIGADSPEMQEKQKLENQIKDLRKEVQDRQLVLKDLNSRIHELEFSLSELTENEESLSEIWQKKDLDAQTLDKELEQQEDKLDRADKLLRRVRKEITSQKSFPLSPHLAARDIDLRELQDVNKSSFQQLAEIGCRFTETAPVMNRYLSEKGLTLPTVRASKSKITPRSTDSTHRSLKSDDSQTSFASGPTRSASIVTLSVDDLMKEMAEVAKILPCLKTRRSQKPSRIFLRPNPKKLERLQEMAQHQAQSPYPTILRPARHT